MQNLLAQACSAFIWLALTFNTMVVLACRLCCARWIRVSQCYVLMYAAVLIDHWWVVSLKASLLSAVHVTFMSMNSSAQMLVVQLNEAKIFEVQCVITLYVYMLWQGTLCIRSPIARCTLLILPYNTCTIYHCLQLSLPCHTACAKLWYGIAKCMSMHCALPCL